MTPETKSALEQLAKVAGLLHTEALLALVNGSDDREMLSLAAEDARYALLLMTRPVGPDARARYLRSRLKDLTRQQATWTSEDRYPHPLIDEASALVAKLLDEVTP